MSGTLIYYNPFLFDFTYFKYFSNKEYVDIANKSILDRDFIFFGLDKYIDRKINLDTFLVNYLNKYSTINYRINKHINLDDDTFSEYYKTVVNICLLFLDDYVDDRFTNYHNYFKLIYLKLYKNNY